MSNDTKPPQQGFSPSQREALLSDAFDQLTNLLKDDVSRERAAKRCIKASSALAATFFFWIVGLLDAIYQSFQVSLIRDYPGTTVIVSSIALFGIGAGFRAMRMIAWTLSAGLLGIFAAVMVFIGWYQVLTDGIMGDLPVQISGVQAAGLVGSLVLLSGCWAFHEFDRSRTTQLVAFGLAASFSNFAAFLLLLIIFGVVHVESEKTAEVGLQPYCLAQDSCDLRPVTIIRDN